MKIIEDHFEFFLRRKNTIKNKFRSLCDKIDVNHDKKDDNDDKVGDDYCGS